MAQSSVCGDNVDDVTLDEVRIMLDEEKLRQIALRKDIGHLIRIEAINRIQNERILKELALSGDEEISIKAVNNISNQELLAINFQILPWKYQQCKCPLGVWKDCT